MTEAQQSKNQSKNKVKKVVAPPSQRPIIAHPADPSEKSLAILRQIAASLKDGKRLLVFSEYVKFLEILRVQVRTISFFYFYLFLLLTKFVCA